MKDEPEDAYKSGYEDAPMEEMGEFLERKSIFELMVEECRKKVKVAQTSCTPNIVDQRVIKRESYVN